MKEKVIVPKYVADWYEENKRSNLYALLGVFSNKVMVGFGDMGEWAKQCGYTNAQDTIAKMHLHGYEIEEEQKFLWCKKDVFDFEDQEQTYLNYNKSFRSFFFSFAGDLRMDGDRDYQTLFTESELKKMISIDDFNRLEKVWP